MDDYNDEPIATGWAATHITGDTAHAKLYIREARKMLGNVRATNGVNQRIAGGEPGGFFKSLKVFPDGTLVEVITNNGADKIRIHAPEKITHSAPHVVAQEWNADAPAPVGKHDEHQPPSDRKNYSEVRPTKKETPEEVETEEYDFFPYLWVGVRIVEGGLFGPSNYPELAGRLAVSLHLCVWEPGAAKDDPAILSNRCNLRAQNNTSYTPEQYPLRDPYAFLPEDDSSGIAYNESKMFQLSRNNPQGIKMHAPDDDQTEWDEIVIADPDDELGLGLAADITPGDFLVKVMAAATECLEVTPVTIELKIIIGKGKEIDVATTTFVIDKFTSLNRGFYPKGFFVNPIPQDGYNTVADYGDNPHGEHWWQKMGVASIPHEQIGVDKRSAIFPSVTFTKADEVPPTGFVIGEYPSWQYVCPLSYYIGWGSTTVWPKFDHDGTFIGYEVPLGDQFHYTGQHSDMAFFVDNVEWWLSERYGYVTAGEISESAFQAVHPGISFGQFATQDVFGSVSSPDIWGGNGSGIGAASNTSPYTSTSYFSNEEKAFSFIAGITDATDVFQSISDGRGRSVVVAVFPTPFPWVL